MKATLDAGGCQPGLAEKASHRSEADGSLRAVGLPSRSGVRHSRLRVGPPKHAKACDLSEVEAYGRSVGGLLAIDLFCGAGGLSLGLEAAGFDVILGVDIDPVCIETRQAHFGGCSLLADLSSARTISAIAASLRNSRVDLLAAAPPCQPYSRAGRSKLRSLAREPSAIALWEAVLQVTRETMPRAILIENVPGLTEHDDIRVVARLAESLEALGYVCHARCLAARDYGVPQHRERIFLVAVERGTCFKWPTPCERITVRQAISDLPPVEGGVAREWLPYAGPRTHFQASMRHGVPPELADRIYDHYTRPVRDDDLAAFRLMDDKTRYSDLPPSLRRYRADIFEDKYKRLPWDDVSRTITAHLCKDGYWYIHPEQHRTLTVREAARLQTFPDWFRFAGTPAQAFRQIGNAVPPRLGEALGKAVLVALTSGKPAPAVPSPSRQREALVRWLRSLPDSEMAAPWRRADNLWHILLGMTLFERRSRRIIRDFWPTYAGRWPDPETFLADPLRHTAIKAIGRASACATLDALAASLARCTPQREKPATATAGGLLAARYRLALTLSGQLDRLEITPPLVRVAGRLLAEDIPPSRVNGRLALHRIVGCEDPRKVVTALLEVADRFCDYKVQLCAACPLQRSCPSSPYFGRAEAG